MRAAIFLLRLCTSLGVFGCSTSVMAFNFEGLARIPCLVMRFPKNGPSSMLKEHFFRRTFDHHVIDIYLKASKKHFNQNPERDSAFQLILGLSLNCNGSRDPFHINMGPCEDICIGPQEVNTHFSLAGGLCELLHSFSYFIGFMCRKYRTNPSGGVEFDGHTLAFITTGAEELLPPEGNIISLISKSSWKWQYLDMSRDSLLPNIRGGCSKLLVAFFVARISLGLLDRLESSPWLGPRTSIGCYFPFFDPGVGFFHKAFVGGQGGLWRGARLSFLSLNHRQNQRYDALRVDPKSVSIVSVSGNEGPGAFAFSLLDVKTTDYGALVLVITPHRVRLAWFPDLGAFVCSLAPK
nr:hypothetical protein [Tanacetum cinerariifolium]